MPLFIRHLALFIFIFITIALSAQNAAPVVQITQVTVDESSQNVSITYDLVDSEGDACNVWLNISSDGGETFLTQALPSGDVGAGIQPGTGRNMVWTYSNIPDIYTIILKVVADDGHVPDIQTMVDQVDTLRLLDHLQKLAIVRHHTGSPTGLNLVRDTLFQTFTDLGHQTALQPVFYQGFTYPNVLGRQPGLADEAKTFIVDAHYDGVTNAPGADDNATGVVATLEIARILSKYQFKNSLRYIGFAFEEQGLVGSQQYVNAGIKPYEEVEGVLNMEMIGYYSDVPNSQTIPSGFSLLFPDAVQQINADQNKGNFLVVVGNVASQSLINTFLMGCDSFVPALRRIPLAVPGTGTIAPDLRRSDHARFWDAGMKALMLTDGADTRNANYHKPADSIGTLNMQFLGNSTKAVLAAAALLGEPINAGADQFALSSLSGLHDHAFPCKAEVFPNPTKHTLYIRLGECGGERLTARLFNLEGKELIMKVLQAEGAEQTFQLPITHLSAGTYLLVLDEGHSSLSLQVVVD